MWEVLLGTAAANKAASIGVGLSVLLGAAGTAEMTGIGPAVRDIVVPAQSEEQDADTDGDEIEVEDIEVEDIDADEIETDEIVSEEELEHADHPQDDREQFVAATEHAPGNLLWHMRYGAFHLRGILVDEDGLAVRTAGPDGETVDLPIDPEFIAAHMLGPASQSGRADEESSLDDYIGYLVEASGECTEPAGDGEGDAAATVECTVNELRILGSAGQPEGNADAEELTLEGDGIESDDDDADGESHGNRGQSQDEHGKPEHAGGPKDGSSESSEE